MARIVPVLSFWRDEVGPTGWYRVDPQIDEAIRIRFGALWRGARVVGLPDWGASAEGALARIIVFDQFPRNMFRGSGDSYATDDLALAAANEALEAGHDLIIDGPLRQFFYLPFMHSEQLADQDRGVDLFRTRLPGENERHAQAHRFVIAEFGRFPWRNTDLGRVNTPEEEAFLKRGGYAYALNRHRGIAT